MSHSWMTEFNPSYQLPAMPQGMVDTSWHNDVCPSYARLREDGSDALRIWIEHPDKTQREYDEQKRFMVVTYGAEGTPGNCVLETENWGPVLMFLNTMRMLEGVRS